jgi:NADH-quinone oxidoreductase subunit J
LNPADLTHTIAFYALALVSITAALMVVSSKRIFRSAVALAVVLICGAGFYILLNYDFIAGVQLLVYVGGIVVLIVFAVMLTSSLESVEERPTTTRKALGLFSSLAFLTTAAVAFSETKFPLFDSSAAQPADVASAVGRKLLDYGADGYVLPFEIISLLLLSSVIGAIVVARNPRRKDAGNSDNNPESAEVAKPERGAT